MNQNIIYNTNWLFHGRNSPKLYPTESYCIYFLPPSALKTNSTQRMQICNQSPKYRKTIHYHSCSDYYLFKFSRCECTRNSNAFCEPKISKNKIVYLNSFEWEKGGLPDEMICFLFKQIGRNRGARRPQRILHNVLHPNLRIELLQELSHGDGIRVGIQDKPASAGKS